MKKSILLVLTISGLALLLFNACKKKDTSEVDAESRSAIDNAVADQEFTTIVPATNAHAINTKGMGANYAVPIITCDSLHKISGDTSFGIGGHIDPVYELDLNSINCSNSFTDGKVRSGKWRVKLNGKIKVVGTRMRIDLISYKAGGINYSCDSIVVKTLAFSSASTKFEVRVYNGKCSTSAYEIKYNSNRTITHYPKGDPDLTDPSIEVYGTADGVNREGRTFTATIPATSPLIKKKSCQYIQSGILTLSPEGFKERTVDYGYSISPNPAGGCDEDASFTVNGNTIAFKLK
jgi:hypothetical protein